jgi:hypothetical protein
MRTPTSSGLRSPAAAGGAWRGVAGRGVEEFCRGTFVQSLRVWARPSRSWVTIYPTELPSSDGHMYDWGSDRLRARRIGLAARQSKRLLARTMRDPINMGDTRA